MTPPTHPRFLSPVPADWDPSTIDGEGRHE
jgi:hypothetical protein